MEIKLSRRQRTERLLVNTPAPGSGLILAMILVLAALLRLYHIQQPYIDLAGWRETSVAMMADNFYHRNPNILYPEVSWSGPGISYNGRELQTVSYISNLLYRVVGQHDWVGRMVAILFGLWGIFAFYKLVQRIWNETHALVGAAIMAILPGVVYVDRAFLPDPAMVSLSVTGLWMYMSYLQTDKTRYLLLAAVFACWGFLSKITGMLLLLPMLYATIAIWRSRGQLNAGRMLKVAGVGLLVFVIVAAYYLWARHLSLNYPPYHFAGEGNWLFEKGLLNWLQQGYFLLNTLEVFANWTLGWPFLILFIAGIVTSLRLCRSGQLPIANKAPYFFHYWLAGCCVFYAIGAKELVDNFWNFHIGHPMIAAFCASAFISAWTAIREKKRRLLPVATLLFFIAVGISNFHTLRNTFTGRHHQVDYDMGLHLAALRKPDDLVVVAARELGNPIAIYYSGGRGWVFPPAGKQKEFILPATDAECIAMLESLRQQGANWFAVSGEQYQHFLENYPLFAKHINSRYRLAANEDKYLIFQL